MAQQPLAVVVVVVVVAVAVAAVVVVAAAASPAVAVATLWTRGSPPTRTSMRRASGSAPAAATAPRASSRWWASECGCTGRWTARGTAAPSLPSRRCTRRRASGTVQCVCRDAAPGAKCWWPCASWCCSYDDGEWEFGRLDKQTVAFGDEPPSWLPDAGR